MDEAKFSSHLGQKLATSLVQIKKAEEYMANSQPDDALTTATEVQASLAVELPTLEELLGSKALKQNASALQELERLATLAYVGLAGSYMIQTDALSHRAVSALGTMTIYNPNAELREKARTGLEAVVGKCRETVKCLQQWDRLETQPEGRLLLWESLKSIYNRIAYSACVLGRSAYNQGHRLLTETADMPDCAESARKSVSGIESMNRALDWCKLVLETYRAAAKAGMGLDQDVMLLAEITTSAINEAVGNMHQGRN